jgi:hypothetical protein
MGWKSGWETLQAYQHYFDPQRHAEIQDQLHHRMDEVLKNELACPHSRRSAHSPCSSATKDAKATDPLSRESDRDSDSDLEYLFVLGGGRGAPDGE